MHMNSVQGHLGLCVLYYHSSGMWAFVLKGAFWGFALNRVGLRNLIDLDMEQSFTKWSLPQL